MILAASAVNMAPWIYEIVYLVAAVSFVMGLKWLASPETARRGMHVAELGMALAVIGTMLQVVDFGWILAGLFVGTAAGAAIAVWTPMTAMPERTALSHAFGALAAALVGIAEFYQHGAPGHEDSLTSAQLTAVGFECLLGALTFTGSMMAFVKLREMMRGTPITWPGQNFMNIGVLAGAAVLVVAVVVSPTFTTGFYVMIGLALAFGVLLVLPIGAADMPTVISLLNSYAGLAACATGFVLDNKMLIVAGALDGASGVVLSIIMCKAMNRSMTNVLFGAFGQVAQAGTGPQTGGGTVQKTNFDESAEWFREAKFVIIVPGYGMAAAQAQHGVREFADALKARGTKVSYAIHPVAGRMPGHMNVLLAEAGVPYDELIDMDDINPEFPDADVVLVMGANDVTNPGAKTDPSSAIYGMPVLDCELGKRVIVCKRSLKPGFAGIDNPLYTLPNTWMLLGDAKGTAEKLAEAMKPSAAAQAAASIVAAPTAKAAHLGLIPYNGGNVSAASAADLAPSLRSAKRVVIVPGYGLAVGQAQLAVRDLTRLLEERGIDVQFAIHPVAGRLPGHMNLVLAEADIDYAKMPHPEKMNGLFSEADVVLVIGANDIVNPDARNDPQSPLAGLATFDAERAKSVIVIKRSLDHGYAGVPNPLFLQSNCRMLFADSKTAVSELVGALKSM